ncbi:MAG: hypothetical protein WBY94_11400, partial [Polyangiaceae bacterium]
AGGLSAASGGDDAGGSTAGGGESDAGEVTSGVGKDAAQGGAAGVTSGVNGSDAGEVTVTNGGCALPQGGVFRIHYVEDSGTTCGSIPDAVVNGEDVASGLICPGGTGTIVEDPALGGGCNVIASIKGCLASNVTGSYTGIIERVAWSVEYSSASGIAVLTIPTGNELCEGTYVVTITRVGVDGDATAVAPPGEAGVPIDANGAAPSSGVESAAAPPFDGTSGKPCSSNADCGTTGINVCSNTYSGKLASLNGVTSPQFWPTPLCMVPLPTMAGTGNCDPGGPGSLQFCDSADPRDPASPGICLPLTTPPQAGADNGFCLPHCSFAMDGSAVSGCPGKDTCVPLTLWLDPISKVVSGQGYCQGTCQADIDCSALGAGWVCQTDEGVCTRAKRVRTKAIGTACTNSGNGATPIASSDTETGACNCPYSGTTTSAFYCTSACVVGGVPCPSGYVCDALVPAAPLTFAGTAGDGRDVVLPGPTTQNPGLAGICLAACTKADAGVVDAGSQCPGSSSFPPLSTCTAPTEATGTVAGPDCLP